MANVNHSGFKKALAILLFIPVFILICVVIYYLIREGVTTALMDVINRK